jgi:hypothetical protein
LFLLDFFYGFLTFEKNGSPSLSNCQPRFTSLFFDKNLASLDINKNEAQADFNGLPKDQGFFGTTKGGWRWEAN